MTKHGQEKRCLSFLNWITSYMGHDHDCTSWISNDLGCLDQVLNELLRGQIN